MSPTIALILCIGFSNFYVNILAELLVCSKPRADCVCVNVYSDQISYSCADDRNNSVDLYITQGKEIKIDCLEGTSSKRWYSLLDGIDVSGDYDQIVIRKCPIPEKRVTDILSQLSIGKIRTLSIDYTNEPNGTYGAELFADLHSVEVFNFRNNRINSLPENVFVGLPNLTQIFLNRNNLQRIPANLFKPVPKVTFLDLAENNLTRLEVDTFQHVPKLKTLNLNANKLSNLTREIFTPLRDLIRLDLNTNGITTFNEDVFRDLSKLQNLNLNFNNIGSLSEGVFSSMKSLKTFRAIQTFDKTRTEMPQLIFSDMELLESVTIENNNFIRLPEDMFGGTIKLTTLSLRTNRLKELPAGLFRTSLNLEKLDLSNNRLTALNETLFRGLKKLVELNLGKNSLTFIHGSTFADLKTLHRLNLDGNRISSFQDTIFNPLKELRYINLNNNQMLDMKSSDGSGGSVLRNCLHLLEVLLRNNSVSQIFEDWQIVLTNLENLDLSYNKLEILKIDDFQFVQANVKTINVILDHNNISSVDLRKYEHTVEKMICENIPCRPIGRELKVSIKNNPINCDCRNYDFIRLIQGKMSSVALSYMQIQEKEGLYCVRPENMSNATLIDVDLTSLYCPSAVCPQSCSCRLRASDRVTEVNCTRVDRLPTWLPNDTEVELYLAHNNLENLVRISPLMGAQVTKLSLSWNALRNIDDLNIPRSLKVLELDHNRIASLSKDSLEALNRTRASVSLHNNPVRCDCTAKYLLIFIKHRISESLIPHVNNITCVETNVPFIHLSVDDLCSNSLYVYVICLAMAISGILFGALTLFYLRYEHEIKAFMFAHEICLWLVTEKEVDRDKEFDAFISYAHQDEDFVVQHLIPNLENGPHPYKLCLHYRNWIVGDLIPEQIVRSVGSSRRTIIVLSRKYLESRWANLEFRTAYVQALNERHARVIVILLEDLDPTQVLIPELKAYITMNTYLKWGDSLFWEKLRYALPHPQQQKKMKSTVKRANIIDGRSRKKLLEALNLRDDKNEKSSKPVDIIVC